MADLASETRGATRYAWYALGVMTLVHTLSFIDRQILSILAEQIRVDLDITDAQIGFLYGTAFAVFYTIFGIPLGRLADSWRRTRLMAIGLGLWSLMTACSGFASSYAVLAFARLGVGIGEASASPAALSMQADYFPRRIRGRANAIYACGVYLGIGLSLPLGGAISQHWNDAFGNAAPLGLAGWQAAFIAVGLPGLLVAAWVWSLREPQRLGVHGEPVEVVYAGAWKRLGIDLLGFVPPFTLWSVARYPKQLPRNLIFMVGVAAAMALMVLVTGDVMQWSIYGIAIYALGSWVQVLRFNDAPAFRLIWGTPGMLQLLMGLGSMAVISYCVGFWAAPYAIRTYHLSPTNVGLAIGIPGAIGSTVGVLCGGLLSDLWRRRDVRGRIFTCMLSPILTTPLLIAQYYAPTFTVFAIFSFLVYASANMWLGSAVAALQEFVLPRMFGVISATYIVANTLIGLCIGPYGSGKVATVTGDLRLGVFSALVFAPISVFFFWLVSRKAATMESTKAERARAAGEGS